MTVKTGKTKKTGYGKKNNRQETVAGTAVRDDHYKTREDHFLLPEKTRRKKKTPRKKHGITGRVTRKKVNTRLEIVSPEQLLGFNSKYVGEKAKNIRENVDTSNDSPHGKFVSKKTHAGMEVFNITKIVNNAKTSCIGNAGSKVYACFKFGVSLGIEGELTIDFFEKEVNAVNNYPEPFNEMFDKFCVSPFVDFKFGVKGKIDLKFFSSKGDAESSFGLGGGENDFEGVSVKIDSGKKVCFLVPKTDAISSVASNVLGSIGDNIQELSQQIGLEPYIDFLSSIGSSAEEKMHILEQFYEEITGQDLNIWDSITGALDLQEFYNNFSQAVNADVIPAEETSEEPIHSMQELLTGSINAIRSISGLPEIDWEDITQGGDMSVTEFIPRVLEEYKSSVGEALNQFGVLTQYFASIASDGHPPAQYCYKQITCQQEQVCTPSSFQVGSNGITTGNETGTGIVCDDNGCRLVGLPQICFSKCNPTITQTCSADPPSGGIASIVINNFNQINQYLQNEFIARIKQTYENTSGDLQQVYQEALDYLEEKSDQFKDHASQVAGSFLSQEQIDAIDQMFNSFGSSWDGSSMPSIQDFQEIAGNIGSWLSEQIDPSNPDGVVGKAYGYVKNAPSSLLQAISQTIWGDQQEPPTTLSELVRKRLSQVVGETGCSVTCTQYYPVPQCAVDCDYQQLVNSVREAIEESVLDSVEFVKELPDNVSQVAGQVVVQGKNFLDWASDIREEAIHLFVETVLYPVGEHFKNGLLRLSDLLGHIASSTVESMVVFGSAYGKVMGQTYFAFAGASARKVLDGMMNGMDYLGGMLEDMRDADYSWLYVDTYRAVRNYMDKYFESLSTGLSS